MRRVSKFFSLFRRKAAVMLCRQPDAGGASRKGKHAALVISFVDADAGTLVAPARIRHFRNTTRELVGLSNPDLVVLRLSEIGRRGVAE